MIDRIHLMSGESKQTIRGFFESLVSLIVLNYIEGESTNIPFLGTVSIEFLRDKIDKNEKEAVIDIRIDPDSALLKNIGQIQDGEESDIEKLIKIRIQDS